MTQQFFTAPWALRRLHAGPLGQHIDSFADDLREKGYARSFACYKLRLVGKLSKWLTRRRLGVGDLNSEKVQQFIASRKRSGRLLPDDAPALKQLLVHLRSKGVIASEQEDLPERPIDRIERTLVQYLKEERSLVDRTVKGYLPFVRQFLLERFEDDAIALSLVEGKDILAFVARHAHDNSPTAARSMVTALRSFFRFLRMRGDISIDLAACVPSVADWRLSTLPKSIEPEQVEMILQSCDRRTMIGRRDYAVLLLLARLALRAGEVAAVMLDDINWESGELTIRGKGNRYDRLPITSDVGRALAAYLKNGRPNCASRRLFIRSRAPLTGFVTSEAVGSIVRRAFRRAAICSPHKGAHVLRHSAATMMLKKEASLREIGAILRHEHPDTTAIYAKVDLTSLRTVARPWPGGES
jgi:site-specific recombinase XerD